MRFSKTYIILFGLLFATFVVVFNTFPRSTFSELEKRELATFPEFTAEKLFNGSFTSEVSSWFSDSEPFRDRFMALSMKVKDLIRLARRKPRRTRKPKRTRRTRSPRLHQ